MAVVSGCPRGQDAVTTIADLTSAVHALRGSAFSQNITTVLMRMATNSAPKWG